MNSMETLENTKTYLTELIDCIDYYRPMLSVQRACAVLKVQEAWMGPLGVAI